MSSADDSPAMFRADSGVALEPTMEDCTASWNTVAPLHHQDPMALFDFSTDFTLSPPAWTQAPEATMYPSPAQSNSEPVLPQMWLDVNQPAPFLGDMADPNNARVGSSLFSGYLEIDGMLKRISGGTLILSIPDFGDQGAVIQPLRQVVEATVDGTKSVFSMGDRSVMRLAILAVRKACELADYGIGTIVATQRRRSSSLFESPAASQGSPLRSPPDFTLPSSCPEQIAAMIRVDNQLASLNSAVAKYCLCEPSLSSTENAAVSQSQHLLLQIHLRIKRAMESMVPEWNIA